MREQSIIGQRLASRRAMLLGMTLAEVVLIVLFCLLLLLGARSRETEAERALREAPWTRGLTANDISQLGKLLKEIQEQLPDGLPRSEAWQRLTDNLRKMRLGELDPDYEGLLKQLADAEEQARNARNEAAQVRQSLLESQQRNVALESEIERIKAGSPPPCLHYPPSRPGALRGETMQLGAVYIEDGRMTLLSKHTEIPSLSPVDYLGRPAEYVEALEVLQRWPLNRPLSLQEFGTFGREFLRIGDDESGGKLKCRFTMDYRILDGTPIDMLVVEFERYFYKAVRLVD